MVYSLEKQLFIVKLVSTSTSVDVFAAESLYIEMLNSVSESQLMFLRLSELHFFLKRLSTVWLCGRMVSRKTHSLC